jgi:uncharacterized protein YecE (DUF72 family)
VRGLGGRLGPLLVQLPPSLALHRETAEEFLVMLRERHAGDVVCEPRHDSWFTVEGDALLTAYQVARVGADPARRPAAALPGGWPTPVYLRLHGSPRMYYSDYSGDELRRVAELLRGRRAAGTVDCWCVFDNTALGAATGNALALARMVEATP